MRTSIRAVAAIAMAAASSSAWSMAPGGASATSFQPSLAFEPNVGQARASTDYLVRGAGHSIEISPDATVIRLRRPDEVRAGGKHQRQPEARVVTRLVGANTEASGSAEGKLASYSNYIPSGDPKTWRTKVPQYQRVAFDEVYRGIDLAYYGKGNELEYDFIVEPGADTSQIKIRLEGIQRAKLDGSGNLVMTVPGGRIVQKAPIAYQEVGGKRKAVTAAFKLDTKAQEVAFQLGAFDRSQTLVIDPVLSYATYFGGPGTDDSTSIVVDSSGSPIFVGYTTSTIPTTAGAVQPGSGDDPELGGTDAFITKLNSAGTAIAWSTYLGGTGLDEASAVAVDANNNVVVAGSTDGGFPVAGGAQMVHGGATDAFIAKLSSNGASLLWSTYLGGPFSEFVVDVGVDAAGSVIVAGNVDDMFPTANGYIMTAPGGGDGFVAKFNSAGSSKLWATYIGGAQYDVVEGMAIDGSGNPVILGTTDGGYPTVFPVQATFGGGVSDAFLTKLNTTGTAALWSTYIGGTRRDEGRGVGVDLNGNILATGLTDGQFPTQSPVQASYGGSTDMFIYRISGDGATRQFASYYGGSLQDIGTSIAADKGNSIIVGGYTSGNFRLLNASQGSYGGGGADGAVVKIRTASGFATEWATYLGGVGADYIADIAAFSVTGKGLIYVTGQTGGGFPVSQAVQATFGGDLDAFVARLEEDLLPPTISMSLNPTSVAKGKTSTLSWSTTNATSCTASGAWSGIKQLTGNEAFTPPNVGTYTYTLTCTGSTGSVSQAATLTVTEPPKPPTVDLVVAPTAVNLNATSNLTWTSTDTTSCTASGAWTGDKAISGAVQVSQSTEGTYTYTITCTGTGGTATDSATLTVAQIPPTVTLTASPTTFIVGGSSTLAWTSKEATSCSATGSWSGGKSLNGSQLVTPTDAGTYVYTLTCTGVGGTASANATVTVTPPAPTLNFTVTPSTISIPNSATLSWSSTNVTACTASGAWNGSKASNGSQPVSPTIAGTYNYTMRCTGDGGEVTKTVALKVNPAQPKVTITALPNTIQIGQSSTITWDSTDARDCVAAGAWEGTKTADGSMSVTPTELGAYTYSITCTGDGGSVTNSTTLTVREADPAPEVSLKVTPGSIFKGSSANIEWASTNADSCTASGSWTGAKGVSGSSSVSPTVAGNYTYVLNCTGPGGSASASAGLTVTVPPPTVTLTAAPTRVSTGSSTTLTWSSTDAISCTASGSWAGGKALTGSQVISYADGGSFSYTLTCTGDGGTAAQTVGVDVTFPAPTADLSASALTIKQGQSTTLNWTSANTTGCTASGAWSGALAASGSQSVTPTTTGSFTYNLTCAGKDGSNVADQVVVTVNQADPPPTVAIASSPASVVQGNPSTLTWSSTNATDCVASGAWTGGKGVNGSQAVTPTSTGTFTYTLSCTGPGGTAEASTQVAVTQPPAPTVSISLNPAAYVTGGSSTLSWSSTNATSCTASNAWTGTKSTSGVSPVAPTTPGSYSYTLTCTGAGGSASNTAILRVDPQPPPTADLTAAKQSIKLGETVALSWISSNTTGCTASGAWSGALGTSGTQVLTPAATGTYVYDLSCLGKDTTNATDSVTVTVNPPDPKPTVNIAVSPTSIEKGQSSQVTWTSANATSCSATGAWTGSKGLSGSQAVTPVDAGTYTYTLTCDGSGGTTTASANLTVTQPPAPTLTIGLNPIMYTSGGSSTLSWSSTNATTCSASGSWTGSQVTTGSTTVNPTTAGSYTYTLTCNGTGGSVSRSATLTVNAPPAPTVSIGVSPTPIQAGGSATVTWDSTNADSCTASGDWAGSKAISGSEPTTKATAGTYTYTITCTGGGGTTSRSANLTVSPPPGPTLDFTGAPVSYVLGGSTTLNWTTTNADNCSASGEWTGSKAATGSQTVTPASAGTKAYTLTCTGAGGSISRTVNVTVAPPPGPTVTFTGTPLSYVLGGSTNLSWSTTNATDCVATGEWTGAKAITGAQSMTPTSAGNKIYGLTCTGAGGTASATVTVTVAPPPGPTLTFSGTPLTYVLGGSTNLTWTTANATDCTASGEWTGTRAISGSQSVTPASTGTKIYTLTCNGAGGSIVRSVNVTVTPPPLPVVTFSLTPTTIFTDQSSTLTWSAANATSCTASGAWTGSKAVSGTQAAAPGVAGTYTYTLSCTGAGGTTSANATLTVQAYPPPTLTMSASPTSINTLQTSTLTWASTNTTSCTATGGGPADWSGSKALSGSQTILANILVPTRNYTLTCTGKGGSISRTVTITTRLL